MSTRAIKVLFLIEDNLGDARLLREMLKEQGLNKADLKHVETMREAETHLNAHAVDIILLDLGLPDAQGLDALRLARAAAPRVPIVVLTGFDDEAMAAQALQEGAQDYLIKGQIDARDLHRALRHAIERKITEDALFVEKERAEVTLNCIGDAVACTDVAGNLTFINLVAENMSGLSSQQALGRPWAEVFRVVDAAAGDVIANPMTSALSHDETANLPSDSLLLRADGVKVPIEGSVATIHDRASRVTGAVVVFRDVSAARAMALQLAKAADDLANQNRMLNRVNGKLAAIIRSSPIAIYATDREGIVTMWSPAAERLTGFSEEEAVGTFDPMVPQEGAAEFVRYIHRVCAGESLSSAVLARRKKDGAMIEMSISMGPLTDDLGAPRGAIFLAENVTEQIAERKKIARMQSEFISTVSHELRTPLTSIRGSLGLIAGGGAGAISGQAARLVDIAHDNTRRLIRLVNDILDIEKLQSGLMAFRFAPVHIDEIIGQAIDANLAYAATFGIKLCPPSEGIHARLNADPDRVNQAVTNLIANAVKFSLPGARVEISAAVTKTGVRVSVEDHGTGIPESFRPRIFQRFAQADSSDIRQKGGSGLGLSIVREIMERHGGSVSFDSEPGVGSRFHLDFPALALAEPQTQDALGAAA
jgi:PAS domain S-box-containing protein